MGKSNIKGFLLNSFVFSCCFSEHNARRINDKQNLLQGFVGWRIVQHSWRYEVECILWFWKMLNKIELDCWFKLINEIESDCNLKSIQYDWLHKTTHWPLMFASAMLSTVLFAKSRSSAFFFLLCFSSYLMHNRDNQRQRSAHKKFSYAQVSTCSIFNCLMLCHNIALLQV